MKTLKVGIATLDEYKKRTLVIARGEYKPAPDEPKVWFHSLETMSQILSDKKSHYPYLVISTEA